MSDTSVDVDESGDCGVSGGKFLSQLLVAELKQELDIRNLKKVGNKRDLMKTLGEALLSEGKDPETYCFQFPGAEKTVLCEGESGDGMLDKNGLGEESDDMSDVSKPSRQDTSPQLQDMMMMMKGIMLENNQQLMRDSDARLAGLMDQSKRDSDAKFAALMEENKQMIGRLDQKMDENKRDMIERVEQIKHDVSIMMESKVQDIRKDIIEDRALFSGKVSEMEVRITELEEVQRSDKEQVMVRLGEMEAKRVEERQFDYDKTVQKVEDSVMAVRMECKGLVDSKVDKSEITNIYEKIKVDFQKEKETMRSELRSTQVVPNLVHTASTDVKFGGDLSKLHPNVFIKYLRNRVSRYGNMDIVRELIRELLTGEALIWYTSVEESFESLEQFEKFFLNNYWGESTQMAVRERLYNGKFNNEGGTSMSLYATSLYAIAKQLKPQMLEGEVIMCIARHFRPQITDNIIVSNINDIEQLNRYLKRVELNSEESRSSGSFRHNQNWHGPNSNRSGQYRQDNYSNSRNYSGYNKGQTVDRDGKRQFGQSPWYGNRRGDSDNGRGNSDRRYGYDRRIERTAQVGGEVNDSNQGNSRSRVNFERVKKVSPNGLNNDESKILAKANQINNSNGEGDQDFC